VCVCVKERQTERDREGQRQRQRDRKTEREDYRIKKYESVGQPMSWNRGEEVNIMY
jgi:Ni/Co efflux regulator RcnB